MIIVLIVIIALLIAAAVFFFVKGRKEGGKVISDKKETGEESAGRMQVDPESLNLKQIAEKGALESDFFLHCYKGSNQGEDFLIPRYVTTIGRRSTDGRINDIEISSIDKNVSRTQGMLVYKAEEQTFYLINEANVPITVNGELVLDAYPLKVGDKIEMGNNSVGLELKKREKK